MAPSLLINYAIRVMEPASPRKTPVPEGANSAEFLAALNALGLATVEIPAQINGAMCGTLTR